MPKVKLVLEKLGTAIYLHKELIKKAECAKAAVDYLAKMGVFAPNKSK